jgi:iron complex transport system permease protein
MNTGPSNIKAPVAPGKVLLMTSGLLLLLAGVMTAALCLGTVTFTPRELLRTFMTSGDDPGRMILIKIRLPRILLAGLSGFALSLGGVVFQAILRNPLADPFILGVSSGAAFGAVLAIMCGFGFTYGVPAIAFCGALLTIGIVWAMGRREMGMESSTLILAGVIINAFFTSIIMFFIALAVDDRLHTMLFWLYGDMSQSRYAQSMVSAPFVVAGSFLLYGLSRHLNLITAGREAALQMGVDLTRVAVVCFVTVSLLMGLVVSFSGLIGFIGLVIPHLARMMVGADHRLLMPVSALGGAVFLIAADTFARTAMSPSELPVGVVTAFLGAPFFIYLLRSKGSRWNRS